MAAKVFALLLLCVAARAGALRADVGANQTAAESTQLFCRDYCVQCNDGSTVMYGRSKSWFQSNLFTEGLLVPITGIGNMTVSASKEEFTSFTGHLPTTGFFCEKVDVVKFPVGYPSGAYTPLMLADLNELKPYLPLGRDALKEWAQPGDLHAYTEGCKIMKASGMKGSAKQFGSLFQHVCADAVTKSVDTCSQHSRLCGKGGVSKIIYGVGSYGACRWGFWAPDMCPRLGL